MNRKRIIRSPWLWGLVILAKGGITLWLLESLSTANFVLIKGGAIITLTVTAAVVTIAWSYLVVREHGRVPAPAGVAGAVPAEAGGVEE